MTCKELGRQLGELQDGILEKTDCAAIEKHLKECESCGALSHELEDLARLCREWERPRMPPDVRRRIEQALK